MIKVSFDKTGKLRAKIDKKSYRIYQEKKTYFCKKDGNKNIVTRQVNSFLKMHKGGNECRLPQLPKELIDDIISKSDLRTAINSSSVSVEMNKFVNEYFYDMIKALKGYKTQRAQTEFNPNQRIDIPTALKEIDNKISNLLDKTPTEYKTWIDAIQKEWENSCTDDADKSNSSPNGGGKCEAIPVEIKNIILTHMIVHKIKDDKTNLNDVVNNYITLHKDTLQNYLKELQNYNTICDNYRTNNHSS